MENKTPERLGNRRMRKEFPSEWEITREPPTVMSTLPRELLLPYPPWATYLSRGTVAVYEAGVLASVAWVFTKWQGYEPDNENGIPFPAERYTIPLVIIVAALLVNLSALIATIMKRYHVAGLWRWMTVLDAAVGGLSIYGSIMMTSHADKERKGADVPWLANHATAAALLFALG